MVYAAVPEPGATPPQAAAKAPAPPLGAVNTNPSALAPTFLPAEPATAPAPVPAKPAVELTTLKLLLAKGVISQEEYDSALKDMSDTAGARAGQSPTVSVAGWKTTLYGFVEASFMWNSTQSFEDCPGNKQVARPDTYAGTHPRFEAAVRHSRFGFRVAPPTLGDVKTSGNLEFDFMGGAGSGSIASATATLSESSFFTSPVLRIRHAYAKIETPIVDVLFGQTWNLFGWAPNYVPAVAHWPGLPGQAYGRNIQFRVSKTIKSEYINLELALAAMRPPQRDSAMPEGQAGLRILFPKWTSWRSGGLTGTTLAPASLAVSGTIRQLRVGLPYTPPNPAPTSSNVVTGSGISASAYLPVIPASKDDKSNSLSLIGGFATGTSINDLYSGLTGGVANATGMTFGGGIDSGLLAYDSTGKLHQAEWLTSVVGMEYYLPSGRVALFVTWGHTQLQNASVFASPTKVRNHSNFYEAGFFVDVTQQVRVGVDYARIVDVYQDSGIATNDAVQGNAYFFF